MIKPTKNFRMPKSAKTQIALLCNSQEERVTHKHLLIQGQLAAEAAIRRTPKQTRGVSLTDLSIATE